MALCDDGLLAAVDVRRRRPVQPRPLAQEENSARMSHESRSVEW
jgi:hypothetical protein